MITMRPEKNVLISFSENRLATARAGTLLDLSRTRARS
jgi:hypothetical protein